MQIIKNIMLFLIFISSSLIGKYISQKYVYRLRELEEIKNALNIFKTKIKFTYEPIPDIFEEIAINTNKNIAKIFTKSKEKMEETSASKAWEETIEEYEGNLNHEDKHIIKMLSKMLRNI